LIAAGSYCPRHRWPSSPGRLRGRGAQQLRARVLAAFGHRCANCGATGVRIEVHHRNHDHTDNRLANLVALCRACHARAGSRPTSTDIER
jgi:5-methylcytosine-specific restriction endonuclease McrA